MANLLYYTERIAKWCTALGAFDTMCMARAPIRGQILANLVVGPAGPTLGEGATARSDSRGLHGRTSSGRYILISFDLLERLNRVLTMTGPRTSCFRETTTDCQVSEC